MKDILVLALGAIALVPQFASAGQTGLAFGESNAPVTIEEFSDLRCPFCQKGSVSMEQVLKDYPGKVRVVFRNFPLPAHGPIAQLAAKALTAISLQCSKKAHDFEVKLFEHQDQLGEHGEAYVFKAAREVGADIEQMKTDMQSDTVAKLLAEDVHQAELNGVEGTPTFLVGKEKIVGAVPYPELKQAIERQLAR